MSFFQNPFFDEYRGSWPLGDRQYSLTFICPQNFGRGAEIVQSYGTAPFNLSGNDADGNATNVLNIRFAIDAESFKNWASIAVSLVSATGTVATAVTIDKIIASLNADTTFAAYFTASASSNGGVQIRQKFPATRLRFYILNTQGETLLNFNKFAGVGELPTYFMRHTVDGAYRFNFEDALNNIAYLDTTKEVDKAVINNSVDVKGNSRGFVATTVKEDWELLEGRVGIFVFRKNTVNEHDQVTETIEYSAGMKVGDLARKIVYTYNLDSDTNPATMKQMPYTLTSGDLLS